MPEVNAAVPQENPRAWLKLLCAPEYNPKLGFTFLHDIDGETYECATNGHAIIAVLGAGVTTRRDGPPIGKYVEKSPVVLGRAKAGDLAYWGSWVECRCDDCDPAGATEHPHPIPSPFRLGRLFGRWIDRWYVYEFLENLKGECEIRSGEVAESPVQFFGDGWIVTIMPFRERYEPALDNFPPLSSAQQAGIDLLQGGA